ncbi:MBL fold metallo-hydrolase [Streptomyces mirabilis]|uniref:MBL fold metallo-hydrolase n=1 Tax=Streptomyces mirabilis TaxID=68239 RepID=UPI003694FF95
MKKRFIVAAAAAVPVARLARSFASSPLPVPPSLSDSIPIPEARPPAELDVVAVPTGVNKRVAAYGYRGGSFFEKRDFNMGAVLIRHPSGDLLVDTGFGRGIDQQMTTMPPLFQRMTKYEMWKPARDQLEAAGYDFGRLAGILLTHAHWDHVSGLPDFPGVPVLVTEREKAAFDREGMHGYFGAPFSETSIPWSVIRFESGPYLGFPRSHDVHGDGSIVCVPAPGHTPGSIIVFVTLANHVRYALVGDLVWQREGLTRLEERPWLVRRFADLDADGNRRNLLRMASILQRIPDMIVVPAHDQRAFAEMTTLPNVITKGLIL